MGMKWAGGKGQAAAGDSSRFWPSGGACLDKQSKLVKLVKLVKQENRVTLGQLVKMVELG